MTLQFQTQTKAAKKIKATSAELVDPETVNKYATKRLQLEAKQAKLQPLATEVKTLEDEILGKVNASKKPGDEVTLTTPEYELQIGKAGNMVVAFDRAFIEGALDAKTYNGIVTFKVEDLKRYLTGKELPKAVTYERKKKRVVNVVRLVIKTNGD